MQLLDAGEQVPARARLRVVGGALVRVLAVGEVALLPEGRDEPSGNDSRSANQTAIADSYAAVDDEGLGGERAARVERQRAVLPELGEHVRVAAPGAETGATCAKFFAAARSIAGPPMSIISTASSSRTPCRPATSANG